LVNSLNPSFRFATTFLTVGTLTPSNDVYILYVLTSLYGLNSTPEGSPYAPYCRETVIVSSYTLAVPLVLRVTVTMSFDASPVTVMTPEARPMLGMSRADRVSSLSVARRVASLFVPNRLLCRVMIVSGVRCRP
jgi:hypothetical protein